MIKIEELEIFAALSVGGAGGRKLLSDVTKKYTADEKKRVVKDFKFEEMKPFTIKPVPTAPKNEAKEYKREGIKINKPKDIRVF